MPSGNSSSPVPSASKFYPLEERLIYELKYFKESGKHLDAKYETLCAGSYCDGQVFRIYWRNKLYVRYWHVNICYSHLYARETHM